MCKQPLSKDSIPRPRQPIHSHHTPRNNTLSPSNNYNVLQTKSVIVRGFIFDYCENTTVHGMRYISERDRHWTERLLWTFLCIMAFSGTVYLSILIWDRYITSPTVSVIETTNFPISNVPFPSVTLCDYNRVHWSKALIFQKEHLPNASNETIRLFHGFLKSMAQVAFGDFDFIKQDVDYSKSPELAALNITELMLKVMPQCQEMFHGVENCWWRNNYFNCCENARKWFDSSAYYLKAPERNENSKEELRPRRTSSYGPWGGLRFTLNTSHDTPPDQHITSGIIVVVNSPQKFPESGRIIPTGQAVSVDIDAYVTYTVERVRSLSLKDRGCLYIDEGNNMDLGGYVLHNCIIECHRNYTIKYCNCTPYFYYSHRDDVRSCDISGYLCLSKYNLVTFGRNH
ncbi:hypothetical protein C0J52_03497 [Blattella germanica]|nr:hypothetical protein C0J52_03497 [Blattella germanica]